MLVLIYLNHGKNGDNSGRAHVYSFKGCQSVAILMVKKPDLHALLQLLDNRATLLLLFDLMTKFVYMR